MSRSTKSLVQIPTSDLEHLKYDVIASLRDAHSANQLANIFHDALIRANNMDSSVFKMGEYTEGSNIATRALSRDASVSLEPSDEPKLTTLKQIIIVHRHGSRFPNEKSRLKNDLSWPTNNVFWEKYQANLTPIGCFEMFDIGSDLRGYYYRKTDLFDRPVQGFSKFVSSQCSNTHRTLFSAWCLLRGLFPRTPASFVFQKDRTEHSMKDIRNNCIPIIVESEVGTDALFHQWKGDENYKAWKLQNFEKSKLLIRLSKEQKYLDLADKLYKMTGFEKLSRKKKPLNRVAGFKGIYSNLAIAERHNLPPLSNVDGLSITEEEGKMIKIVADEVWRLRYRDADSDKMVEARGESSAGLLAHEISRRVLKSEKIFVEYSCHDSTMLALASRLGIGISPPCFGGYFLFELHQDTSESSQEKGDRVKFFFNPDPMKKRRRDLKSRQLLFDDVITPFGKLPNGCASSEEMIQFLQMYSAKVAMNALAQISSEEVVSKILSYESPVPRMNQTDYESAFRLFTTKDATTISRDRLMAIVRQLDADPSREVLDSICNAVSVDSEDIDLNGFIKIIDALAPLGTSPKSSDKKKKNVH